jgi:anti-sigma B factor antagonist
MNILQEVKQDYTLLIVISPTITGDDTMDLKDTAVKLINEGVKNISLDLSKAEYIDSSGVGKLLYINKKLEKLNGKLTISKINSTLYFFLESLALTKVIDIKLPGE